MRNLFFLLMIILVLSSCKKKDANSYIIEGVVNDESLNGVLANASITLLERKAGDFNYVELTSTTSDSEGKYKLSFQRNRVTDYKVVLKKDKYLSRESLILPQNLTLGKSNEFNWSMAAISWVKIHLQNVDTVNNYDEFIYQKIDGSTDCEGCCPNIELHFYGALDTTFFCVAEGNRSFSYYYELRNSTTLGNEQKITIPFDTISFETTY